MRLRLGVLVVKCFSGESETLGFDEREAKNSFRKPETATAAYADSDRS